ncbi:LysM peptidoglycan-binding domain-containing protein [Pseudocitrobacter faecalis]|uniref:LysM domain-containing protein n=1 Tax=Pseudocitrobacter faecalis TaxID=1398493 RepID=A0ABX9FTU7_9ENTR|nr:LysM domain-containing protein [Pseudocitrobacter faecalis]
MTAKPTPLFDGPQDKTTKYDGLLGWSANWKCFPDQEDKPVPLDDIISLSPDKQNVIVLEGETLEQIARDYNCSVKELAEYNHILNPDLIYPGQIIYIPQKHYTLGGNEEKNNNQCVLSFAFEDLIEKPIGGLKVKLTTALGEVYESVTDGLGKISDITAQAEAELKIYVSSGLGKLKEVASFTPQEGRVSVLLSSPKVRVKGKSAALTGPAGNVENASAELNKIITGRDSEGKPRIHLNHVCPNSYDLRLGKNVIYWEHIIRASKRSGIIPQSIAAVINAEAAKYSGGVWNPISVCKDTANSTEQLTVYKSSAAGMTQFLNGTWMSETLKEGTYLYEKALEQGIVADKPLLNKKGEIAKNKNNEIIHEKKFQISTNTWKNLNELKKDRNITGITPYPSHATTDVLKWLNQRFNPEYAIMAAVDYGVANLAALKAEGYNIDGLNDAEKAKIIYLTHHLGLKNARRFIGNEITEDSAWMLLKAQVGSKSAIARSKKHGGYVKAHREWLNLYINNNIILEKYFCDELTNSNKIEDVKLNIIINKL